MMKKTLLLNPPSYEGFDGGAGSRFQAKREVRSFWYPTWLAQVAALLPGSRLIDAPARGLLLHDIVPLAGDYELLIIYASAPTFNSDIGVAEAFKAANPNLMVGLVGAHVATLPEVSLLASASVDFVARHEFDFTIQDVAQGKPLAEIDGLTWRKDGQAVHNKDRALIHDMDVLPSVIPVYARDLTVEDYYIGYLRHPYVSFYTGRGCRSKCSYCLWPQTIGGSVYRTRSPAKVLEDVTQALDLMPQVKEVFFDDDTFTDDLPRAEEVAKLIGPLLKSRGVTWSVNAKANVPLSTLKVLKESNLRQLLVGYESGNQTILNNIRKGLRLDIMRKFTADCHKLGITVHGAFVLGLPGESRQTIDETIRFAKEIDPHSLQVSLAAPYPGTELYAQAQANGWFAKDGLVESHGNQTAVLSYPGLSSDEIFAAVEEFYRAFYFRPRKIAEMVGEMLTSRDMFMRRIREGIEFFQFLKKRNSRGSCDQASAT
jgi:hopanoid biosynthesis associated radical SAM protein HpnJ